MAVVFLLVFRLAVLFVFVYLAWRKLRVEHQVNDLLLYLWTSMLAFLIGGRLVFGVVNWGLWENWWQWIFFWRYPGMIYAGSLFFVAWWTVVFVENKKWKLWHIGEEMMSLMLFLVVGMMLGDYVWGGRDPSLLIWSGLIVVAMILDGLVLARYRSLWWYPSGKKGFTVCFDGIVLGIGGLILSIIFGFGIITTVLSGLVGLTSMSGLIILGESFKDRITILRRKK